MKSLHRFLVDYDMAMLRVLAQTRGVMLASNRQAEAADQLATALLDPLSVQAALARLSPQGQRALATLRAAGAQMRAAHYERRFGRVQPVGPGRLEREAPWLNPASPAEELWYLGLIFRAFAEDAVGPGEFVFIPDDLLPLLPDLGTGQPGFALEAIPAPGDGDEVGPALVQDLFTYLVYVHTHGVRPYADGRLSRRDLASLRGRLADPDEGRLAFLRHMAGRLGFVVRQGEVLRLEAVAAKRWLSAPPSGQLRALQDAWRDDPTWVDLCCVPDLACDPDVGWLLRYDPVATRRAFLRLLARCPLDLWWTLDSFVRAIYEVDPDFQRPDGDYTSWYIRDAASGAYLSGFESWDRVEGALIRYLFAGPLRWLGIVATSARPDGPVDERPEPCRLTGAGVRFLALVPEEPEPPPAPSIVVHPDFRVDLPAPANLYTRFQLERFAELESADPCRYRLSVGALGRALTRGIQVEQVLAFLQQASGAPVQANVAGQLRLWAGRFGQAELEEVAVLRVRNERVLRELLALPQTRPLIGRALSPTTALVDKRNLLRLRRELAGLGYLAGVADEPGGEPAERG